MIWINGRLSWTLVLTIAYATLVVIATDFVWRMIEAPMVVFAGSGLAVMAAGVSVIFTLGARSKKRQTKRKS
jgi:hypothetical protein